MAPSLKDRDSDKVVCTLGRRTFTPNKGLKVCFLSDFICSGVAEHIPNVSAFVHPATVLPRSLARHTHHFDDIRGEALAIIRIRTNNVSRGVRPDMFVTLMTALIHKIQRDRQHTIPGAAASETVCQAGRDPEEWRRLCCSKQRVACSDYVALVTRPRREADNCCIIQQVNQSERVARPECCVGLALAVFLEVPLQETDETVNELRLKLRETEEILAGGSEGGGFQSGGCERVLVGSYCAFGNRSLVHPKASIEDQRLTMRLCCKFP
ncbi:uncharacterized protein AKAME5_002249600 [Lates japonicus]|uniref:Uncharacterized protein n=1 Tax=Lates japonicus TaxID=270547 RepID=A0AAD3RKE5_LATJO|nr:uncharacterized protein AKAME5_002249600 [Lates japonicus]